MAYVMMLFLMIMLVALGLSFLLRVGVEASSTMSRASGMQAKYLAEAGANHAKWRLLNDGTFPADEDIYYMHSFGGGRYGYKVRRHTNTTFATIASIGVLGDDVVQQSYVLYVSPLATVGKLFLVYDTDINILDTRPRYRQFDGTSWLGESTTTDVGERNVSWVELAASPLPTENEFVLGTLDAADDINLAVWSGTSWGNQMEFVTDANEDVKCFDIAYETISGEALVMGRTGFSSTPLYTIWGYSTAWEEHIVDPAMDGAYAVHAADIDDDGDMDVIAAAENADDITWWENTDGSGTAWTKHTIDSFFDGARAVYAADIDNDGDLDVLGAANGADDITWWENTDGAGTSWTEHTIDSFFDGAWSVFASDVDGDNDLDVLGAAFDADDITWWENMDGSGTTWIEHTVSGTFDGAISVHAADIDDDGDIDILGAGFYANDVTWWENIDGSGTTWTEHTVDGTFDGARSVYAADVDGDNDLDVVGGAFNANDVSWWENLDGSGTSWTEHLVDGAFAGVRSIYPVDLDGDADMDILGASSQDDEVTWWENVDGAGTTWTENILATNYNGASSVYAADVNGDGNLNVLGAANVDDDVSWWGPFPVGTKSWVHNPPISSINTGGGIIRDIVMASSPNSDEILIAVLDWNSDINLIRWSGASFTHLGEIETNAANNSYQVVDIAYEQSGEAVIVWGDSFASTPRYRTWDGATLSAEGNLPSFGSAPQFIRAEADPSSDYIFVAAVDGLSDINVAVWDGTAWIDSREVETSAQAIDRQIFDIAWENSGGHLLTAWGRFGTNDLQYFDWHTATPLSSVAILAGPDFLAAHSTIQAISLGLDNKIVVVATTQSGDLYSSLWNGSVFVNDPPILLKSNISNVARMSFDGASLR